MDRPLRNLDARDPKFCLSFAARVRIDDADAEGDAIRTRADGRILARHRFAPEPNADFNEYSSEDARDALVERFIKQYPLELERRRPSSDARRAPH